MAALPYVNQRALVGIETTPGTFQAPSWRPTSVELTIQPEVETSRVRPSGSTFDSTVFPVKSMTSGSFEGVPSATDLRFLLELGLGAPTTTVLEAAKAASHVFKLTPARKTASIQYGQTGFASQAVRCFLSSLGFEWGRGSSTAVVRGDLMGGQHSDGATLATTGVTSYPVVPFTSLATEVSLGGTVLNAHSVSFELGDLAAPVHYLRADNPSIGDVVQAVPDGTAELMLNADAEGRAVLASLRAAQVQTLRITSDAGLIPGAATARYSLTIEAPVAVEEANDRDEQDSVYAITAGLRLVEVAGSPLRITLTTSILT